MEGMDWPQFVESLIPGNQKNILVVKKTYRRMASNWHIFAIFAYANKKWQ